MVKLVIDNSEYEEELGCFEDESEFEELVKKYSKQIFGKASVYFSLKHKLTSEAGVISIPDGYVILPDDEWCIVEVELSKHQLHEHITTQLNKFTTGIKNPETRRELIKVLYYEINSNNLLNAYIRNMIYVKSEQSEIKDFLDALIHKDPKVVIIIDSDDKKVREACSGLKIEPTVIELKAFCNEVYSGKGIEKKGYAYTFEPLYEYESHAEWSKTDKGFICKCGSKKHNSDLAYEPAEIIDHIQNMHGIDNDDIIIDGWKEEYQAIWDKTGRKIIY